MLRELVRRNKVIRNFLKATYFLIVLFFNFIKWSLYFFPSFFLGRKPVGAKDGRIYIFGWYGTETAGDKLILLGLLWFFYRSAPGRKVSVVTMVDSITRQTLDEISLAVSTYSSDSAFQRHLHDNVNIITEYELKRINRQDSLVLGGGPIMDDPILSKWYCFAFCARLKGAEFFILGNGVGPLRKWVSVFLLNRIVALSSGVIFRCASDHLIRGSVVPRLSLDPAFFGYFVLDKLRLTQKVDSGTLAVNSRSVPYEYVQSISVSDHQVVQETAKYVLDALEYLQNIQALIPYSTHEVGAVKDSKMSCAVIDLAVSPAMDVIPFLGGDLSAVLETALRADYVITTRFHGMIIGLISGCKVAALDYSDGDGKSLGFYSMISAPLPASKAYCYSGFSVSDFICIDEKGGIKKRLFEMEGIYRSVFVE